VALKSVRPQKKKGEATASLFLFFIFSHGVRPGHPAQARKDKQACESNLACLGSRRRQDPEKEQARKNKQAFNSSSNELKACLFMGNVL